MAITYSWATGYYARIDATTAGERIMWLKEQHGRILEADDLVEDATPEDAPLHPAFEWDNKLAAHEYRLEQARSMLRCIEIEVKPADDLPHRQRLLVHVKQVPSNGHRQEKAAVSGYMLAEEAQNRPDTRDQIVERGLKELRSWVAKYEGYVEFRPLLRALRPFLSMQEGHPKPRARSH